MNYTPKEVAKLLKDKPHQPHYIEAIVKKAVDQAAEHLAKRIEELEEELKLYKPKIVEIPEHYSRGMSRTLMITINEDVVNSTTAWK